MNHLDITCEDQRWSALDFDALATEAIRATLHHLGLDATRAEVSILACDDAQIAVLNASFRNKPSPTNVLSWPSEERAAMSPGAEPRPVRPDPDGLLPLGDIAISFDICTAEASAAGKPLGDHATHLIVHGTLHLLGYDHETAQDAALMEGLEVKILGKLGLDDPYKDNQGA